jgi:hypothetical protein
MAITKLSSGPYTIHTINLGDPITLDAGNVYINGNLHVQGKTSTIETTNTLVYDNIITLNGGISGAPTLNAGVEVNRGSSANVSLIWNETVDRWQITSDGTTYANILSTTGSGSGITAVIDDPAPALGGNLNLNSKTILSNVGNMNFQGNIQVNNTLTQPSSVVTNATVLYAAAPNFGASGLYVLNSASTNEELVTKKRALGFSLLF